MTVIPNEVIFMLRNVCGKVRERWEERKQKDPDHRREGDRSLQRGCILPPRPWGGRGGPEETRLDFPRPGQAPGARARGQRAGGSVRHELWSFQGPPPTRG